MEHPLAPWIIVWACSSARQARARPVPRLLRLPLPRHLVRYYCFSRIVARGKRKKAAPAEPSAQGEAIETETTLERADRAALRRRWAEMIRRVPLSASRRAVPKRNLLSLHRWC